jgi:4-hydroxybenzoate polyprenyltransferase
MEADQVNHPDRPLPSGHLTPTFATVLYFLSLAAALFSTKFYVAQDLAFLYYALIALSISYGYVVDCLPGLKAPYVATLSTTPILIVASSYQNEPKLYLIAASIFFLYLGREICMDIKDREGDAPSFMHVFRPVPLAIFAFSMQTVGLLLAGIQARRVGDVFVLVAMILLLALAAVYWFKLARYKRAILIMKLPYFVGLYFLL